MSPTRVLLVDDSRTIRQLLRARLAGDARIAIVGEASDPLEAREMIKALNPDVLTLDVEMPHMNGLEFLEKLMRLRPMPVVMISTLTHRGSAAAIEALSLGAVDCLGKPGADRLGDAFAGLADMLVIAAGARVRQRSGAARSPSVPSDYRWGGKVVLIGASTGGVEALETVLAGYPADGPPTLVTQHMPPGFLTSFASRLDGRIAPRLELAADALPLLPGRVYLAPGGDTHLTLVPGDPPRCRLHPGERRSGHRPSVDVMFLSAVPAATSVVAVQLTGMGRDGAEGMRALRDAGARCIAQDEETSVVYGMPKAAMEIGGAEAAFPLSAISAAILGLTGLVPTTHAITR